MKKLLAVAVSVILILSSLTLFACDSTFDGNYKEVSSEQAQTVMEKAKTSESTVSINSGMEYELKVEMKQKSGDKTQSGTLNFSVKTVKEDDDLKASAKLKAESSLLAGNLDMEIYATGNNTYVKSVALGVTTKTKIQSNFNSYYNSLTKMTENLGGEILEEIKSMIYSPAEVSAEFPEGSVKFYLDDGETSKKIKVEINAVKEGETIEGAVYIVLDLDYKVVGTKIDISMKSEQMEITLYNVSKAYNGKISLPSDLDEYTSGADALSGLLG